MDGRSCGVMCMTVAAGSHRGATIAALPQPRCGRKSRLGRNDGCSPGIDVDEAEQILEEVFDLDGLSTKPKVHSLGLDPFSFGCNIKRVATVTFANTPETLRYGDRWGIRKRVSVKGTTIDIELEIDTTFLGFTPLNLVKDDVDHKIE
ncbi:uncharacterized protein B0I36DRAFT_353426 [Microdochium trichocladiopsis]|uniref:Uncharacterized protein n=1 Tax=Microdochium trichocladiopsis TaxID=1682393 RepID=A0A9P9BLV0_9PEZI|nr:uncharacterized protein B0I36DRAFT_353426 [Microdochium trichocladiopsis]KAH7025287.1 hypothetical protein B0I36DRAFT_353426 [Microdochium trichocladiopsis]